MKMQGIFDVVAVAPLDIQSSSDKRNVTMLNSTAMPDGHFL